MNTNTHAHAEHSQDFLGFPPAHGKAKILICDLQRVADVAGWVTFEAVDVLMGNLKPPLQGIVDLRRGNNYEHASHVSHSRSLTLLQRLLFLSSFVPYTNHLEHALIKLIKKLISLV